MTRAPTVLLLLLASCAAPAPAPSTSSAPSPVRAPATEPEAHAAPAPAPSAASEAARDEKPACPAPVHGPHCLWLATMPPNPRRAAHVAAKLSHDGFNADADGDRIIVHADDAELAKLFGAPISHELRPASSSSRNLCVGVLGPGARLVPRYAGEVGELVLDDPACEL